MTSPPLQGLSWKTLEVAADTPRPGPGVVAIAADAAVEGWAAERCVDLARSWSSAETPVTLVDLSVWAPRLHTLLDVEGTEGATDVVLHGVDPSRAAREVLPGLRFVAAGKRVWDPARMMHEARLRDLLEPPAGGTTVFFLPLDLPGCERALEQADQVILLATPDADPGFLLGEAVERLGAWMGPGRAGAGDRAPGAPDAAGARATGGTRTNRAASGEAEARPGRAPAGSKAEPAEPATQPAGSTSQPVEPTSQPVEPTSQPAEPTSRSAEPIPPAPSRPAEPTPARTSGPAPPPRALPDPPPHPESRRATPATSEASPRPPRPSPDTGETDLAGAEPLETVLPQGRTLPEPIVVEPRTGPGASGAPTRQGASTGTWTLLLAEDNDDHALLVQMSLGWASRKTVHLFRARNGEEAIRILESLRPDLLLLDLKMPGRSGHEVLDHVKASDELRGIPVAVLTSSDRDEDVERSYGLGGNHFLTKPDDPRKLQEQLRLLLDNLGELRSIRRGRGVLEPTAVTAVDAPAEFRRRLASLAIAVGVGLGLLLLAWLSGILP